MAEVTVHELRSHPGDVLARVAAGEAITVTRSGAPVADLVPHRTRGVQAEVLLERWAQLPHVDAATLRAELDETLRPSL